MSEAEGLTVRHRSAILGPEDHWEFDGPRRLVMLRLFVDPGAFLDFDVRVAAESNPHEGSFLLRRLEEGTWEIAPLRFEFREGAYVATRARQHRFLEERSIFLTHTPPEMGQELIALG